jgi:NADH-quinone oxidoreductase subunit M
VNIALFLHLIVLLPLGAAIAVLVGAPARKTALGAAIAALGLTLATIAGYLTTSGGFQFVSGFPVIAEWKLNYTLGVDGLSLAMLLLSTIVTVAALWVTPKIDRSENVFYACLLFISAGAIGAFLSLDLFFFYAFHELALIPTFILIGVWGSGEKQQAAWRITIYLAIGSIILLAGLIGVYLAVPPAQRTFDIPTLQALAKTTAFLPAKWIFPTLLVGFGVLVSLFPFHSWAPKAYASAPAPAAMLHAGVLKKFGLYGMLRIALPMFPLGVQSYDWLIISLLIGNILFVGLATIAQKQLDMTLGYSSVMHMGYIYLGIVAMNATGFNGAALLMFAHGLSIAALFAMSGMIRERTGTLEYSDLGGLGKRAPVLMFCFGLATFASIGLPGFGNFAAETMVFFGAFSAGFDSNAFQVGAFNLHQIAVIIGLWGVVISAVYMLRAYRKVFMGDTVARWADISDIAATYKVPLFLLLGALLACGLYPQAFLNLVGPTLARLLP